MSRCEEGNMSRTAHTLAAGSMNSQTYIRKRSTDGAIDARIPHMKPRPGRRRACLSTTTLQFLFSITLFLAIVCAPFTAEAVAAARLIPRAPGSHGALAGYTPVGETSEEILYDRSEAPRPELFRRQLLDVGSSTSSTKGKATSTSKAQSASSSAQASLTEDSSSPSASSSATATDSSIDSAPSATSSSLPTPFDGGLGVNYTQPSCPSFLKDMITNATFTSCLPFSVLLQNSMSFFEASRSIPTITQTLSASCNVNSPACSALMSSYALSLRSPSACSDDFTRQNPIVRQAYNSLLAYDTLYRASCLHSTPSAANNQSSDYCFADAITNTSSPTNSYIYYLPLGVPLPGGAQPTCSQCLKDTMAVFAGSASNSSQPVSLTYTQGAQLINQQCGPAFVNQSVPISGGKGGNPNAAVPAATGAAMVAKAAWVGVGLVMLLQVVIL